MPTAEKVLLALSYWLLAKSKTNNKSKSYLAANAREQREFTLEAAICVCSALLFPVT